MLGLNKKQIEERRMQVQNEWLIKTGRDPNFKNFTSEDLRLLFSLIDKYFFSFQIRDKLVATNTQLNFCIDKAPKRAGVCKKTVKGMKCFYELCLSESVMNSLFRKKEKVLSSNGIKCRNRISCAQLVLEHEIMHLIMYLWGYYNMCKIHKGRLKCVHTSHGPLFKCMVRYYFGHTKTTHDFFVGDISSILTKKDIQVGEELILEYQNIKENVVVLKPNIKTARVRILGSDKIVRASYLILKKKN